MPQNIDCGDFSPTVKNIHWRVDEIEKDLDDDCTERKENDKLLFEKFDKLNMMIIYQLCAAILTLVAVLALFLRG